MPHPRGVPSAIAQRLSTSRADAEPLHLLTRSPRYERALAQLQRYAALDDALVLLEGETGTGKTWFARELHARSPRARRAWHHANLAALEDSLASSELFGHVSGAFTGAQQRRAGLFASADGGTLFLDEIGQSSLAVQRKLLHAIEYGEVWPVGADRSIRVDVRVVAATNRPLGVLQAEDAMLHDLAPRLSGFRIRIPSLRERPEDIAALADAMVARDAARYGGYAAPPSLARALVRRLEDEAWPGNVRELESVVRRLLVDADGDRELGLHLLDEMRDDAPVLLRTGEHVVPPRVAVEGSDAALDAMLAAGVSKVEIARRLGVSRATLYRRLAERGVHGDVAGPALSQQLSQDVSRHIA